jgi:glyoxylase-like metal-dependent hydrolase (beta-lactamase superfamily II)
LECPEVIVSKAHIQQFQDDLYLISLPVSIEGFKGFIGAWVYTGDPKIVVDVGPSATIPHLLSALSEIDDRPPELILLTHIHIDHAGGIGDLAAVFPHATVVCHPKGVKHLIDPQRLWDGSLKTLGDIARAYGPIAPLAARQAVASDLLRVPKIECIETPGHAVHHISFLKDDLLFAGEVGGVHLPMQEVRIYLRPATPPRFFLETSVKSIDRVLAKAPRKICYGHIGMRNDAVKMLKTHRNQLLHWKEMVRSFFDGVQGNQDPEVMQACCQHLLDNDPLLAGFAHLPPEVQQRERGFMLNSIKGYWGYFSQKEV